ncbi:Putative killer toxin Kp4/SMK, killer toxin, Kp4 [Colletotrichum destructivum]|uniref:Killer toxin Kp4/SMK, killer toxin, Kp4 n=1 Tax=Colletotrichum destructivum TaxID=34406 RepID=A0AAX4IXG7_9PEZI|nr:Putative killer toxin Kp4/SMK, killer toxin, Kp4 [Colletotrichum destructivum]
MQFSSFFAIVLAAASPATALGINCRGSVRCGGNGQPGNIRGDEAASLAKWINGIDENRWYNNGQQIACTSTNICAFLQNTGGAPGRNIKGLAHFIPEHSCKVCGSVPYFYPGINDVSQGELTFNWVTNTCGKVGLC